MKGKQKSLQKQREKGTSRARAIKMDLISHAGRSKNLPRNKKKTTIMLGTFGRTFPDKVFKGILCFIIYKMEKIVWANSKRRIEEDNRTLFHNLRNIGLFEKYPELGNPDEQEELHLNRSLGIAHTRIFKPLEEIPESKKHHLWIGINPPPGQYTMQKLHDTTQHVVKKYKWLAKNMWCVESHTVGGYRPHIHLMVEYNQSTKPNRVIKCLSNHYQIATNSIECKSFLNGILWGEHIDYIKGLKSDEKLEMLSLDNSERISLNIKKYYINNLYNATEEETQSCA